MVALNTITERDLWFENNDRTLEEVTEIIKQKFQCEQNPFDKADVEPVKYHEDLKLGFKTYCTDSFEHWGKNDPYWLTSSTEEKQNKIVSDLQLSIDNCDKCKKKQMKIKKPKAKLQYIGKFMTTKLNRCKECLIKIDEIKMHKKNWSNARKTLMSRYESSLPGFIEALKYESPDKIIARCYSMDEERNKRVNTTIKVDYSWVVRNFGQEYAAFLADLGTKKDKFIPVSGKKFVRLNKVIVKVKYDPGRVAKKIYKDPQLNKSIQKLEEEKKLEEERRSNDGPNVNKPYLCLNADNETFRITEDEMLDLFDQNYVDFIKDFKDGYVNVPVGDTRKHSTLDQRLDLQTPDSPIIRYKQGNKDLCVVRSFVSALHIAGFEEEASEIDKKYMLQEGEIEMKVNALKATIAIAKITLPECFEFKHFKRGAFDFSELRWNHIFVGVIETTDGHCSHAVTLFNGHIYDSNEEQAIKLCKGGLHYCSSDGENIAKFYCFAEGYLIRCTRSGKKNSFKTKKRKLADTNS